MSSEPSMTKHLDELRAARGRTAYEAAQQQAIFAYGLLWEDLEPVERAAWQSIADAVADGAARQLEIALIAEAYLQIRHGEAWKLIGRLDYALEEIGKRTAIRDVRRWVTKMRAEIEASILERKTR